MTAVEVDRLSLRCDLGRREPARFAIEDALRTELPDDGRLVLVRRLEVAPSGSSARPAWRQAAMRDAWIAATGGARHGGEDGAAEANCVWFASPAEAERLLLDRLLRGRAADGWFWQLALSRWRGRRAPEWLPELLAEASVPAEEPRLMALVEACLAAGAEQVLVAALDRAEPFRAEGPLWAADAPSWSSPPSPRTARPAARHAARRAALMAIDALAPPLRAVLRRLAAVNRGHFAVRALVRAQLLRRSPALDLDSAACERAVREALDVLAGIQAPPAPEPGESAPAKASRIARKPARPAYDADSLPSPRADIRPRPDKDHQSFDIKEEKLGEALFCSDSPAPPSPAFRLPLHSRHAGLWLVVPALGDMGLRPWLARHPDLLGDHPGARLMLAIARHHRVPPDDPALAPLAETDLPGRPPAWAEQWRHGLDRWLRRHARRRLHDLVNRPGRIEWHEQRLHLTYPPGDADIRLRRLALDRDPGWTDWLGLSVRYLFRGQDEL